MNRRKFSVFLGVTIGFGVSSVFADVVVPNVFSDHMVLQRNQENPVWGRADAGEKVVVSIAGQKHETVADSKGEWRVELDPLSVADGPCELKISGDNSLIFSDVLIGEVWMCSGQSNMAWVMGNINDSDMEIATANYPQLRLLNVPHLGTQEPQFNIDAKWETCSPESVRNFSALGYLFGRNLQQILKVPVGLIYNAWGGSDLEAWLPIETLKEAGQHEFLAEWDEYIKNFTPEFFAKQEADYQKWLDDGKPGRKMFKPVDVRSAQKCPANIYNGKLHATIGYGMRGVIWCQGESNIGRAYEYRSLFPLLINKWREWWENENLPFYWIQLADHSAEKPEPGESYWAELREAQTMTLSLPNTGEAVVIDLGEARDIHYRNKQTVAARLLRHALANDYGYKIATSSPRYKSMEVNGNEVTLSFDDVATNLYAFDVPEVKGFSIAGADKKFVWAEAKIVGKNKIKVWSDKIADPKSVRYGWADNPVLNVYDRLGLPLTPFRTDDWPIGTMGKKTVYRGR